MFTIYIFLGKTIKKHEAEYQATVFSYFCAKIGKYLWFTITYTAKNGTKRQ